MQDLEEQRPTDAGDVEYGEQRAADETGSDDDELADENDVHFRSVGAHPPVGQRVDGQRRADDTEHAAGHHEITHERRRAHVVDHSIGHLYRWATLRR